jgi:CheY-like chemotaxis protein
MVGKTVLVVDSNAEVRARLVTELRKLGLHAVGAQVADDALALLSGIAADLVLFRERRTERTRFGSLPADVLLVELSEETSVEEALAQVVRALLPEPVTQLN